MRASIIDQNGFNHSVIESKTVRVSNFSRQCIPTILRIQEIHLYMIPVIMRYSPVCCLYLRVAYLYANNHYKQSAIVTHA